MDGFRLHLLRFMIDDFQPWRERSVQRLEPLTTRDCRLHLSMQFRLTTEYLENVERKLRARGIAAARPEGPWTQLVPLARFGKGVLPEFSARLESGAPAKIMNHFDGTVHTRRFLLMHFQEMRERIRDPPWPETEATRVERSVETYFHLVAGSDPDRVARARGGFDPTDEDRFAAWLHEQVRESVQDARTPPSPDVVRRLLDHMWGVYKDLGAFEERLPNLMHDALGDPVRNPVLLLRDYARFRRAAYERRPADVPPPRDATTVINGLLTIATDAHRALLAAVRLVTGPDADARAAGGRYLRETYLFLHNWIAYTELEMTPDLPIMVKISMRLRVQTEEVGSEPEYVQTFPVPLKDFRSAHVEIRTQEAEMEMREPTVSFGGERVAAERFFRESYSAPPDLHHFITSSASVHLRTDDIRDWRSEFGSRDDIEGDRMVGLQLRLKVDETILRAYNITCFAAAALAVFSLIAAASFVKDVLQTGDARLESLEMAALSAAAVLTLVIFFATTRHRSPIIADLMLGRSHWIMASSAVAVGALTLALTAAAAATSGLV